MKKIFLLLFVFSYLYSNSQKAIFPLGLNSEMTTKDVEKKLKTKLEYAGVSQSGYTNDTISYTYIAKSQFEIDGITYNMALFEFDYLRQQKLSIMGFADCDLSYTSPLRSSKEKQLLLAKKYLYLKQEHKEMPNKVIDSYLKGNMLLTITFSEDFSSNVRCSLVSDKEKNEFLNKEKVYKIGL